MPIVCYAEAIKCEQVLVRPAAIARENLLTSLESILVFSRDTKVGRSIVIFPPTEILVSLVFLCFLGAILSILLRNYLFLYVTDLIHDFSLLFWHFQLFFFFGNDGARVNFFLFFLN